MASGVLPLVLAAGTRQWPERLGHRAAASRHWGGASAPPQLQHPGCRRSPISAAAEGPGGDSRDPIERAVGYLFGEKALEDKTPMGLKRMNMADYPDQQLAVTDKFAAPVRIHLLYYFFLLAVMLALLRYCAYHSLARCLYRRVISFVHRLYMPCRVDIYTPTRITI